MPWPEWLSEPLHLQRVRYDLMKAAILKLLETAAVPGHLLTAAPRLTLCAILCSRDQGLCVVPRPPSCSVPCSSPAERAPPSPEFLWSHLNGEEHLKRSFMFHHQWAGALLNSQTQGPEYVSRCQGRGSRQPKIQDPPLIIFLNLPALFSIRIPRPSVVFCLVTPNRCLF